MCWAEYGLHAPMQRRQLDDAWCLSARAGAAELDDFRPSDPGRESCPDDSRPSDPGRGAYSDDSRPSQSGGGAYLNSGTFARETCSPGRPLSHAGSASDVSSDSGKDITINMCFVWI